MQFSPREAWDTTAAHFSRLVLVPAQALAAYSAPAIIDSSLAATQEASRAINLVDDPLKAAATAAGARVSSMQRVAGFLGKALPTATVVLNTLNGARIVDEHGPGGLLHTKQGRGAVLGATGGGLMLVPMPATQLGAAGLLAAAAANEIGALHRLDRPLPRRT
jgi:hypothetical protein